MVNSQQTEYPDVDASPVKSFFVSMLTRDIQLEDAVLDLLDNCVDGILRSKGSEGPKPYEGSWAKITFTGESFSISDNCGGIPWGLHDYAFRMGRPPDRAPEVDGTVGVYGIGMKRAVFKMGKHCLISTRSAGHQYEVEITPDWIGDEKEWRIPVRPARTSEAFDGTTIVVGELNPDILVAFTEGAKALKTDLEIMIATHYAYIIEKGFKVTVNGDAVEPRTTSLVFDKREAAEVNPIRPFVFKTAVDEVEVFLAVGFTRPIPSQSEITDEQEVARHSSMDAGWTVLCNDRAILHCDRSALTGWGEARVPRYHTQFIAISGIVEFKSNDPAKLPMTTTKRGIDASSLLYLQVKNKMREGMRLFTDYTNKWKGLAEESKLHIQQGVPLSLEEMKAHAEKLDLSSTRTLPLGEQYKPKLPLPPMSEPSTRRIAFSREVAKIRKVADYLGDSDLSPSEVGEACFDATFIEAQG